MANNLMENARVILPMIAEGFERVAFALAQNRTTIYKYEHNFSVPIAEGLELKIDEPGYLCQQQRKVIKMELPDSIYGVAMKSISIPLFDDENPNIVLGCLGIAVPRDEAVKLKSIAKLVAKGSSEMVAAVEHTANSASDINQGEQDLVKEIEAIRKATGEITGVLALIKNIADQIKMLGLNAAIEAARAGEDGRGFGVVAEEIRKLSDESKETAKKIEYFTQEILTKVEVAERSSQAVLKASENQAAATQEFTAGLQELANTAEELESIAQII